LDIPRTRLQKIYTGVGKKGGKPKAQWWSPKYKEVFKEPKGGGKHLPNWPSSEDTGGATLFAKKKGGIVKGNRDAFTQQYD
jgi:hypothetical protein